MSSFNRQSRKVISGSLGTFSCLPQINDRSRKQFIDELIKLHENQYTPINHIPTIFGRQIDLLLMYNSIAKRGGLRKMTTETSWEDVMRELNIPLKCANACTALRNIYQRYLEPFERLQRSKATISDIEEELQMESENRYKVSSHRSSMSHSNFNPISMVYRSDIHQICSQKRQEAGLSCDLVEVVEYQKLELSLKSGLVNEIEFTLNTMLLMSYQNEGLQLWRNSRLLDVMLTTVGILESESHTMKYCQSCSIRRYLRFWNEIVTEEKFRKFLHPKVFEKYDIEIEPIDIINQTFPINDELTVYDKEGQRVQLVATILRNIALDNSNVRLLSQSHQCMRFLFLCCYASHTALHQLGLEILSVIRFPIVGILWDALNDLLCDLIGSEDRVDRLRGLEMISKLTDPRVCNENIAFFISLPKSLFASLISNLIVHDLYLVVLALEAVYGLSEIDPILCSKLIECSSETLPTLYTLISLEAQVMGTQSLIRIRVMQGPSIITMSPGSNTSNYARFLSGNQQQNHKQLTTSLMPPPPVPLQKIPISTSHVQPIISVKSQISQNSEALSSPQKLSLPQKICSVVAKSTLISTQSVPSVTTVTDNNNSFINNHNPATTIVSVLPTAFSQVPNSTVLPESQKALVSQSPYVAVVSKPTSPLPMTNRPLVTKPTCISTPIPISSTPSESVHQNSIQSAHESARNLEKSNSNLPTLHNVLLPMKVENNSEFERSNTPNHNNQVFTSKQDFVKKWLLDNYVEYSQNTVPLFLIYKQLQIAVQSYYKDSEMVSAEEFHKVVRLLFPQVQLVQMHIPGGPAEIHYFNLKAITKTSTLELLLESQTQKEKTNTNSNDSSNNYKNCLHNPNNAQLNCPVVGKALETAAEQKNQKRHLTQMTNGYSTETNNTDGSPKKKMKLNSEMNNDILSSHHIVRPNYHPKDEYEEKHSTMNGIVHTQFSDDKFKNHFKTEKVSEDSPLDSAMINGQILEEMKHSDSEMKAFSSSTVSPIHCESLANGTDGSSEGTLDFDLGRVSVSFSTTVSSVVTPVTTTAISSTPTSVCNSTTQCTTLNDAKRSNKRNNCSQLGRTRSRFRNNASGKGKSRTYSNQRPYNLSYLYICEWDNCLQSFDKPQKVYGHVYTNHFMTLRTEVESKCLWSGCEDETLRTPLPLLNHVNEQHCNNVALESARQARLAKEREKAALSGVEPASSTVSCDTAPTSKIINLIVSQPQPQTVASNKVMNTTTSVAYHVTTTTPASSTVSTSSIISTPVTSLSDGPLTSSSGIIKPTVSSPVTQPAQSSVCQTSVSVTVSSTASNQTSETVSQTISVSTSATPNRPIYQFVEHIKLPDNNQSSSNQDTDKSLSSAVNHTTKQVLKEGPVTKHIRFMSALILRNLCQHCDEAKRFVSARHQQIFEMSVSGCESSKALSECLFYSSIDTVNDWKSSLHKP